MAEADLNKFPKVSFKNIDCAKYILSSGVSSVRIIMLVTRVNDLILKKKSFGIILSRNGP